MAHALLPDGDPRALIENATGGAGDDTLSGNAGENRLDGGAGDDSLRHGPGDDTLLGGDGVDRVFVDGPAGDFDLNAGADILRLDGAGGRTSIGYDVEEIVFIDDTVAIADLAPAPAPARAVQGTPGDDLFARDALAEAAALDGRAGADTLVIDTPATGFAVLPSADGHRLVGPDGRELALESVERLVFTDAEAHLDRSEGTAALARLYQVAYDRLPDMAGLAHWRAALANGATAAELADRFAAAPEFEAGLADPDAPEALVARLYDTALDRAPDAAGLAHWSAALASDALEAGDLLMAFAEAPEMEAQLAGVLEEGLFVLDLA